MAIVNLTTERLKRILQALHPRFVGRDQDHLIALADEAAGGGYDAAYVHIEPLEDWRADIESTAGASLVGSVGPSNVQADIDALEASISGVVIDSIADSDTTHAPSRNAVFDALALKANLASPAFTGNPTAPTPLTADNDTSIATTGFVKAQGYGTVSSVAVANATGITWTGSPITTSGTLTPTLSANLQAWSGLATSAKADASHSHAQADVTGLAASLAAKANLAGTNQFTGIQTVDDNTNGYVTISPGTATTNTGFIGFYTSDDTRRAFIGHNSSNRVVLQAENTWGLSIVGATDFTGGTVTYDALEIGFRDIPRVTGGFERGKMFATAAGVTVLTGSAAGSTYSIYNNSAAAITLTQGAGLTMRLAGTATTGSRTLAARGIATIWFNSTTECVVSGAGVT